MNPPSRLAAELETALGLKGEARERHLRALAATDPDLAARVVDLLALVPSVREFLEREAVDPERDQDDDGSAGSEPEGDL